MLYVQRAVSGVMYDMFCIVTGTYMYDYICIIFYGIYCDISCFIINV